MTSSLLFSNFVRVDDKCPCPICGKTDWCCIAKDGKSVICPRVKSGKRWGEIGWLHEITAAMRRRVPLAKDRKILAPAAVQRYLDGLGEPPAALMEQHCRLLGIDRASLDYMGTQYDGETAVLVFPMWDGNRKLTGCRMRRRDGRKWSLKHGREGLFMGKDVDLRMPLVVTEGATDAAAAVKVGFRNIVGRSNCSCGARHIKQLMRKNPRTPLIVLADPNEVGIDGGKTLAYSSLNPTIVFVGPTDARDYVNTLRTDLFDDVLRSLDGEETTWRICYKNMLAVGLDIPKTIKALRYSKGE